MPSIIPGYVYSLFASVIVGALIVASFGLAMTSIKAEAETQQLLNIRSYVATKCMELVSISSSENRTLTSMLDIPPLIGNQRYWIQIENGSIGNFVQSGFGNGATSDEQGICIPSEAAASGFYLSGSGAAFVRLESNSTGLYLNLYGGS